jgi:hypothetical protein
MRVYQPTIYFLSIAAVAACLTSLSVRADDSPFPREPGAMSNNANVDFFKSSTLPSANNELFKKLRAECETDVASGKSNGDVCVDAAAILLGNDIPNEFRDMNEDQRTKIALRLLERAVDISDRARGRAYDFYIRTGLITPIPYADPYRAKELMAMMEKSGYPGGVLRKIRGMTGFLSIGSSEADKRAGCATAKKMLNEGKLDADSAAVAKGIISSILCVNYEQL